MDTEFRRCRRLLMKYLPLVLSWFGLAIPHLLPATEAVYLDQDGVIRWKADQTEVALFGANYCLPSASDYRAAGYLGVDRKKLIEKDLAHFARLGWDGLRVALWGDWENCDREGNLIANEHLDLMDYLIFQAKQRGIHLLFTPIHRHSSLWPDGEGSNAIQGFSKHYPPSELGRDPRAIAAQQNYFRQILNHVNPYTGVALKDETSIIFIELINEPHHHADDFSGSVAYINALVQAVRDTGCQKLLFHNLTQDLGIAPAIAASQAQGYTIGWYPTGLVSGRTLTDNYLRRVDRYTPLLAPELGARPRIVYEFDSADMTAGYMYPAMVRSFREGGVQFATMFGYDMLDTAPYNLGWQTHYLNLVYTPRKAVSAIIAAEAMRVLPRGVGYGNYPQNRSFGPFRVSYEEDTSEMVTTQKFLHANATATQPPDASSLEQIIGIGNSPVVGYEGLGAYFLERLSAGVWRLEIYPDALFVQDPFAQKLNFKTVSSRLLWREWPMTLRLPDLGAEFSVHPLNAGNTHRASAQAGRFPIKPGVYLLSREAQVDRRVLPQRVGRVGLDEYVCPPEPELPLQVLTHLHTDYAVDAPIPIKIDVVSGDEPRAVSLQLRISGEKELRLISLSRESGYRYAAELSAGALPPGAFDYAVVVVESSGASVRHPAKRNQWLSSRVVAPSHPVALFEARQDYPRLLETWLGGPLTGTQSQAVDASGSNPAALLLQFVGSTQRGNIDYAATLSVKERLAGRRLHLASAQSLVVNLRGSHPGQEVGFTLIEADGTGWTATVAVPERWREVRVPLAKLKADRVFNLPVGFPGRWNYWSRPAQGRGVAGDQLHADQIEQLQMSFRPKPLAANAIAKQKSTSAKVEIATVRLEFRE